MQKPCSAVKNLSILVLLVPAACGMLLARLTTADIGAGVSKDSVEYLAAARSLLIPQSGGLLRGYDGSIFILWPPLYPMLLALVEILTGQDALEAAGWLNLLLFGAAILLVSLLVYYSLAQAVIPPHACCGAPLLVWPSPFRLRFTGSP